MTPDSTIYEGTGLRATKTASPRGRATRFLEGLVAGAAIWLFLSTLGVPNVFHILGSSGLFVCAAVGAIAALTPFGRLVTYVAAGIFILLLIAAFTPLFLRPALTFVRSDPLPASADAVVVLSAGVTADGFLHQQGLDRLLKGLQLVRSGAAPRLLVTREQRDIGSRKVTAASDQDSLAALAGVHDVIATPLEASTHDEAMAVAKIARQGRWKRIIVVTSPFHSRRACATFEHVGLTVSCVPSDSRDIAIHSLDVPSDRVGAFAMWIYEMAATLQYHRKGWL